MSPNLLLLIPNKKIFFRPQISLLLSSNKNIVLCPQFSLKCPQITNLYILLDTWFQQCRLPKVFLKIWLPSWILMIPEQVINQESKQILRRKNVVEKAAEKFTNVLFGSKISAVGFLKLQKTHQRCNQLSLQLQQTENRRNYISIIMLLRKV